MTDVTAHIASRMLSVPSPPRERGASLPLLRTDNRGCVWTNYSGKNGNS